MKKVYFVCYGGGHSNIIDLIAKDVSKSNDIQIKILALTMAFPNLEERYPADVLFKISDYIHLFDSKIDEILKYGNELINDNYNKSSGISKFDTICYLGLSMYDLVVKHGELKARELYVEKKRQAFLPTSIMDKILKYENPDLVVSTTSPRFEQASFIAAKHLGIDTLEILDLFGELYPLPEANNIVVMNEDVKNSLIKQGLSNKKYHILGQPIIESTVKKIQNIDVDKAKGKIEYFGDKKILSYFTQRPLIYNYDFSFKEFMDYDFYNGKIFEIFENISKDNDIIILVRIHPNESYENYEKWINKYENIISVNTILTLEENIAISDIVLTPSSTVGVEAVAAGKKVMTFKHEYDLGYPLPSATKKPFIFSETFAMLEEKIKNELLDDCEADKNSNFLVPNSTNNISKLIYSLVHENRK